MKFNFLTLTLFFTPFFLSAFAQQNYFGNKIKSDNFGNSYVAGCFKSKTLSFGSYNLENSGGSDIFLAKYNSYGKVVWAKNIGGSGNEELLSMDVDINGNISILASTNSTEISVDGSQLKNKNHSIIYTFEFNSLGSLSLSKIVKEIQQTINSYKKPGTDTSLTIISPAANDILKVGTKAKIEWDSENVDDVLLELSTDNGATWLSISIFASAFNGHTFLVPNTPSDSCLLKISAYNNPGIADTSDLFKISGKLYWELMANGYNSVLTSVFCLDSNFCVVVGYNGISKSTDNGKTWFSNLNGIGLFDVFFLNENTGWTVGFNGIIFKTSNGGDDWIQQDSSFNFHLLKVFFYDENNGYMISDSYFIKTTNGGESWIIIDPTDHVLRAMFFLNKDTGWIAGGEGIILKTTDAGLTWDYQQMNGTEYSVLNSLYFIDENTGWSSGSGLDIDGGVVLKTGTSGNQWSLMYNGNNRFIYSICFITPDSGWAVGDEGAIFSTTNGGSNWELQGSGILSDLHALTMKSNHVGWSVGDDGVIIKFIGDSSSLPVSVIANINSTPGEFSLSQNYPNPFNPTTNIGFRVTHFGFVSLKIYDILGREIVTLVNEEKQPGFYEIEYNASSISSGTYFYRLQAGKFIKTKKFVLLK